MKQHAERFTPAALTLSIVTAALADGIPQSVPVRRALWLGAVSTVCLCVLSALAAAALQNKAPSFTVRLALTAGLFMELIHTLVQAQGLCTAEFSSMALLGFLPLLLWAGSGCRYGALRCRLWFCWAVLYCLAATHIPGWSCCGRGAAAAFPAWMRCFCCCGCCAPSIGWLCCVLLSGCSGSRK